jgi:1,4-dihydroxy-2-naphthoyl-CoA hydrolase
MPEPQDIVAMINANRGGWNTQMGLSFTTVTAELCVGELVVAAQHLQPYGIVHGGVHTGIIEAACSTGAAVVAMARGQSVVGLENATSFITAARGGTLRVTARPVTRGRRTQVWEAVVTNDAGKT